MANIAREQAKYDLAIWEQMGIFRTGAGSMGPRLTGAHLRLIIGLKLDMCRIHPRSGHLFATYSTLIPHFTVWKCRRMWHFLLTSCDQAM